MFKFLSDKIAYFKKKNELERLKKKHDIFGGKEPDLKKWYEAHVEWCFHTKSPNLIYCSYYGGNKKDEALDGIITHASSK